MKNLKFRFSALIMTALILSGCSYRVLDFTLISSKNVDLTKGATFVRGKNRVTGKDRVHWIIVIPTGRVNIKEALDRAIESTPGCVALLDGVIYSKFWLVPYAYGQQTITVEGTPLIDPSLAFNGNDILPYGKIELNRKGEIKAINSISATQYLVFKNKTVKHSKETKFKSSVAINPIHAAKM